MQNDPEVAVKKKAVFALSQLPKDEAVPELLHVAQTNANPAVRKEAIFWLGQTHDPTGARVLRADPRTLGNVGNGEIGIGEPPGPIREHAFPVIDIGNLLQSF